MGQVEVAISMVLAEAENVNMAKIGRPDGNDGGGILDTMKTLLHGLPCGFGCETFPVQTAYTLPVSLVIDDLQQQPRQVGAAALEDLSFGGAPRVPSRDFQDENSRSGLYWLYLAMVLLKALFWELGLSSG